MIYNVRAWCYELALVAFFVTIAECFTHLCIAQANAHFGYQFWLGLVGVVVVANGLPITVLCFAWQGLYHPDSVIAHPAWCLLEMLWAFSWLFLFGAGFYFGPAFLF